MMSQEVMEFQQRAAAVEVQLQTVTEVPGLSGEKRFAAVARTLAPLAVSLVKWDRKQQAVLRQGGEPENLPPWGERREQSMFRLVFSESKNAAEMVATFLNRPIRKEDVRILDLRPLPIYGLVHDIGFLIEDRDLIIVEGGNELEFMPDGDEGIRYCTIGCGAG